MFCWISIVINRKGEVFPPEREEKMEKKHGGRNAKICLENSKKNDLAGT